MENYLTFCILSILLIMMPGPDTLLVLKTAVVRGKRDALAAAFGSTLGILIHTTAAAFGLSALMLSSATLYEAVKWAGALYLVYIGIRTFLNKSPMDDGQTVVASGTSSFLQGLCTCTLNPKVALFFVTFLPQFVATNGDFFAFATLGATFAGLAFLWLMVYIQTVSIVRKWLQSRHVTNGINKASGTLFVLFGLSLVLENKR